MKRTRIGLSLLALLVGTPETARPAVTFNKDIAPLVFQHCAECHRPGQAGPFPLLTYGEVRKRAKQIVQVTSNHYMPPWLPDGPHNQFQGDRRLSDAQISLFRKWLDQGTPEGAAADLPPQPHWVEGWQLGRPDLIVQMPRKYTLPAEGRDVYRNFVIPLNLAGPHHIRAVEFRPDNRRIVHHAFVKVDSTGQVRKLDGQDGEPGFAGMNAPDSVKLPGGYFLGWQPGKTVSAEPPGFGWDLLPGQDLVVQAHLRPTGKPEDLQAQIALYFTDIQPTNVAMVFSLFSLSIDIPAGTNAYVLQDRLVLPVAVEVMAVLPHTHYLGKRLEGFAELPDGVKRPMLSIPDWDFNWQGDYRYSQPVQLPAGTTLHLRYVYDNSSANPRNPNHPPKEVRYGAQSSDEMGELWFQVRLQSPQERDRLAEACNEHQSAVFADYDRLRLERNPHDARARTELAFTWWAHGQVTQAVEAFREAARDDPAYDQPHYYLGVIYRTQQRLDDARAEFATAIRLNPENSKAFGNLGLIDLGSGNLDAAETNLAQALKLNPADELARSRLEEIRRVRRSGEPPN